MDSHTADAQAVRRAVGHCLKRAPLDQRLRLLGVRVGSPDRLADLAKTASNEALAQSAPAQTAINLKAKTGSLF